eukprot:1649684-Prymnesium_polylepis.1
MLARDRAAAPTKVIAVLNQLPAGTVAGTRGARGDEHPVGLVAVRAADGRASAPLRRSQLIGALPAPPAPPAPATCLAACSLSRACRASARRRAAAPPRCRARRRLQVPPRHTRRAPAGASDRRARRPRAIHVSRIERSSFDQRRRAPITRPTPPPTPAHCLLPAVVWGAQLPQCGCGCPRRHADATTPLCKPRAPGRFAAGECAPFLLHVYASAPLHIDAPPAEGWACVE